ncbi:hypothetical protein Q4567_18765 [Aliiglaciecola sp. 2_MG-2023]|uniref:hypothetical protein n=1 Tax=unclassified Aliiglaciecola TaxID=2593648 RepID=UPI0026E42EA0|nr:MULTISPECIES: hypothetical protein [unclassified Aliiglaciecola]MDO6712783.1 hypothetical protein [Aliiglaciecola sp. 2_MG-2023]MDO6753818.1 hypothetical protein [Aliiglaciecola sp. 1_MG-2023]
MSKDLQMQLHNQLNVSQGKYTYFLLAIAASAIVFSTQITKDGVFSISLIPLGLAVLSWGLSFYCGCQNILYTNSNTIANIELLRVEAGEHEDVLTHPQLMQAASEGIRKAFESNTDKLCSYNNWQFRFILTGAVLFIIWHLIEMAMRTIGN